METIESRVERLERQNWWYRNILIMGGLVLAATVFFGAVHSRPDVIRARKFEAVDDRGRVSAVMEAMKGHGDGLFRAFNRDGVEVYYAGSSRTGDGRVEVLSKRGKIVVELTGKK